MLTIRFSRVGRKNKAQFRLVLQQNSAAPTGKHVEVLGSYDPHSKAAVLKADKIKEWIGKGAQASDSVYNLLVREGVVEGKKRAVKMPVKEVPVTEEEKTEPRKEETVVKPEAAEKKEEKKVEAPIAEPARNASPSDAGGEKVAKEAK